MRLSRTLSERDGASRASRVTRTENLSDLQYRTDGDISDTPGREMSRDLESRI
jgi:hypothetical protein